VPGGRVLLFPTQKGQESQSSAVAAVDGKGSLFIQVAAPNLDVLWETMKALDQVIQVTKG